MCLPIVRHSHAKHFAAVLLLKINTYLNLNFGLRRKKMTDRS